MGRQQKIAEKNEPTPTVGPNIFLSLAMFATACAALYFAIQNFGLLVELEHYRTAAFFLLFGLFAITVGYPHPNVGHVSFDRIAQVASILVLGPVVAAIVNGLASLLYPWHRLLRGVEWSAVLSASLYNSGMFSLMTLLSGGLYYFLGGPVPLMSLDLKTAALLFLLFVSMQVVNDLAMLLIVFLRQRNVRNFINPFAIAVEFTSCLTAVLLAITMNRMELPVVMLMLVVMSLGMLVLKQFATMRHKLEILVSDRTAELEIKTRELELQATQDKLTRLYNRRYADDYLDKQIAESQRYDRNLCIALADVDHFKKINDVHSHAAGDDVLKQVSRLLEQRCRTTDMIARYGGEEFLLCFPETTIDTVRDICEQLRDELERHDWNGIARDIRVTMSFGIAAYRSGVRRKSLLNLADTRMYVAKQQGRNCVVSSS